MKMRKKDGLSRLFWETLRVPVCSGEKNSSKKQVYWSLVVGSPGFFLQEYIHKEPPIYLYVYFGRYWARKNRNKGDILSTPLGPPPVFHFAPESLVLFALAFRPKEKIVYNWESISNWLLVSLATIHTSYSTPWKCSLLSFGSNAEDQLGNSSLNDLHILIWRTIISLSSSWNVQQSPNRTLFHLELAKINEKYGDVGGDGIKGQLGLNYQKAVLEGLSPTVFRKIHLGLDESGLEDFTFKFIADTWETSRAALLNKTWCRFHGVQWLPRPRCWKV